MDYYYKFSETQTIQPSGHYIWSHVPFNLKHIIKRRFGLRNINALEWKVYVHKTNANLDPIIGIVRSAVKNYAVTQHYIIYSKEPLFIVRVNENHTHIKSISVELYGTVLQIILVLFESDVIKIDDKVNYILQSYISEHGYNAIVKTSRAVVDYKLGNEELNVSIQKIKPWTRERILQIFKNILWLQYGIDDKMTEEEIDKLINTGKRIKIKETMKKIKI